jgi:hypothetical protein
MAIILLSSKGRCLVALESQPVKQMSAWRGHFQIQMVIQELHNGHYLALVQGPLLSCVGIIASALDGRSEGPPFKSCLCQPAVWSSGVVLALVAGSPGFNSRLLRPLAPPGAAGCRRSLLGSPLSCSPWRLLAPPGASWRLLAPPGASWCLPAPPRASWRLLALPGASSDCFLRFPNTLQT